ncbi:protein kinase domain-containing protein [Actinocorallia aurantiaca]|uniref:non-specific serine/threonine protein kinase n=1 Tax=Actinocorallia aurantiaca TaxID=46204 RepID=A0ABP6GHZ7_9ACTN
MTNAAVAGEFVGGRYRLMEPLGHGAAGRVWRALDGVLEREVALKEFLVRPGWTPAQQELMVGRVMREARAAARLSHPGVITVHDIVHHKGVPTLVMEFVRGGSLGALIGREGRLSPERAAVIGFELLDAVGAAHAAGIVHRDLKPDNIMIDGRRVIITDFGVASLADSTALTQAGTVLGTPLYMAPEQIEGLPATGAADLWSVGATLYTAVEGETPFSAPTLASLFHAILNTPARPFRHAGALEPLLSALLQKDPGLRPSVTQAAEALKPLLGQGAGQGMAPPETPAGTPDRDAEDATRYGTVKWFKSEKGHGLITPDAPGSGDVHVHYSRIEMPGYKELKKGQRVSFEAVEGKRGPEALRVRPL